MFIAAAAVGAERGKFTAWCVCGVQMVIRSPTARSVRLIGAFTALQSGDDGRLCG